MMHGDGKSDSSIVPTKLPNEAEPEPAQEAMEGRGLAKGKTPERNVYRTQSREDMSSALERIRQAWRYYLRQEPDAVILPVRIRGGGCGRP